MPWNPISHTSTSAPEQAQHPSTRHELARVHFCDLSRVGVSSWSTAISAELLGYQVHCKVLWLYAYSDIGNGMAGRYILVRTSHFLNHGETYNITI